MIENQQTRKSYNPFKMWGSYVVFGILILIIFLVLINTQTACKGAGYGFTDSFLQQFNMGGPNCNGVSFFLSSILSLPMLFIVLSLAVLQVSPLTILIISFTTYGILGFLVGWAIHSLIRRLRK